MTLLLRDRQDLQDAFFLQQLMDVFSVSTILEIFKYVVEVA